MRRHRRPGRKLLGLDLGQRRIGIAVSDDTGILAAPLDILDLKYDALENLIRYVQQQEVAGIVAGLPMSLSGTEGHQARVTREMAAQIVELVSVPMVFWDERLTTAIADRIVSKRVRNPRKRKNERDSIAAAIMLQDYLDAHPLPIDA